MVFYEFDGQLCPLKAIVSQMRLLINLINEKLEQCFNGLSAILDLLNIVEQWLITFPGHF